MVVKMISDVERVLEDILDDRGVPRNIRAKIEDALSKVKMNTTTSLTEAVYLLDDITSDVNMPDHTRTDIWEAISQIEEAKEKMK
jgi:uncharacterized protein (UPF0147 family)